MLRTQRVLVNGSAIGSRSMSMSLRTLNNVPKVTVVQKLPGQASRRISPVSVPAPIDRIALPKSSTFLSKVSDKVITTFNLDRELMRAGPIGGKVFREMCVSQAKYTEGLPMSRTAKFYYETLNLPKTYQQFFSITVLHMWMLFTRMRCLRRKVCKAYQQQLTDGIFDDMDDIMRITLNIKSDTSVNKYKKEFFDQIRGAVFAYDEGFAEGDTAMAAALWRNIFQTKEDVSLQELEQLVHYVRVQLYLLDKLTDEEFTHAQFKFIEPWGRYDTQVERGPAIASGEQQAETSKNSATPEIAEPTKA